MERHNPHRGGEPDHPHQLGESEPEPTRETDPSWADSPLIYHHITEALREGRAIDDATARCIAAQLHGGAASPLYALASTGALVDGLQAELDRCRAEAPLPLEPWLDALDEYIEQRADDQPVEGWRRLWPHTPAHQELGDDQFANASGAVRRRTIELDPAAQPDDSAPASSHDHITSEVEMAQREGRTISDEVARDIARRLRPAPDSALEVFVACGAVTNQQDELNRELYANWQEHSADQQVWVEALRAYCAQRDEAGPISHWGEDETDRETASGVQPEIWVGSLSDYNHGVLHGMWIDAAHEPEVIRGHIGWILRSSPAAAAHGEPAEEWMIFDSSGFCGYDVSEWTSLEVVSAVARGIAEHGEAYAAWVAYVGNTSGALISDDAFRDHYLGEWDSLEDYVEDVLRETDFYEQLDQALGVFPEYIRRNIRLDVEGLAEEWGQGLYAVNSSGDRVFVFDAKA